MSELPPHHLTEKKSSIAQHEDRGMRDGEGVGVLSP
jgi:hypothetical protein